MANVSLSIIIPTWNTAEITLRCVKTIQNNLSRAFCEIIIIDNGSTDNTRSIFSQLNNIKYIRNSQNLGFAQANNIGATQASGKYLLFLNSDMELIDNSLIDVLKYIKNHQNIGIIGLKFLNPDLSPQASVFPPQTAINAFREFVLKKPSYSKYLPQSSKPVPVWSVSGGALLISQQLFKKVGGWNQKYFMYFEDLDLCRLVRRHGFEVFYYPQSQVIHRHGASGSHLADSQNQWRRLIPGSKQYHGLIKHYLINLIIKFGQKWHHLFG